MNWLDVVFIIVFIFYVYENSHRGFLRLSADLVGIVLAFIVAILAYIPLANFISSNFATSLTNTKPFCFLAIWFIFQIIFYALSKIISHYTPNKVKDSKINQYLAILPALIKGAIFMIMIMALVLTLPFGWNKEGVFSQSLICSMTTKYALDFENKLEGVFTSPDATNILPNFSVQSTLDETTILNFSTNNMSINETAEKTILKKINEERAKLGLTLLVEDLLIRNIARAHSRDMLANGYFSHTSKSGLTLSDRLIRANVNFREAAENIAMAPTPELAHIGLMNSEKHKKNILDPSFTKIGIGVMDAGSHGLMVTEDFAN